jgi:hypothetical protein
MAPRKENTDKQAVITPEKLRQIWTAIKPDDWLNLLNQFKETHKFYFKGKELWGRCPYHNDPHASFHIRFEQGYAKCFGECSKFEGDPIAFVAKVMEKPYGDAFTHIVTTYGVQGLGSSLVAEVQAMAHRQEVKQAILKILNAELVYAAGAGKAEPRMAYAQQLVQWLDSRKIDTGMLHKLPIGVVPTTDRLWELLNDYEKAEKKRIHTEVQHYFADIIPASPTAKGHYEGWIVFANHTTPSTVGSFRIRAPGTEGGDKAILYVTEKHNDGPMGFFGLGAGMYKLAIGNNESPLSKTAVVCEGEFTALAAMMPQLDGDLRQVVVAAGGNNNHCLDSLETLGFSEARILGDRDGGGNTFNNLHLSKTKLKSRVFQWPTTLSVGKDLHDIYMHLGGDAVMSAVTDAANFLYPQDWALGRLAAEKVSYSPDDKGGLAKLAMRVGRCLNDQTEKEVYVLGAATLLDIPEAQLRKHIASPDTEEGFVSMFCQAIEKEYNFMYHDPSAAGMKVVAWNRRNRKTTTFDLAKKNTIKAGLQIDLGPITAWIEDHVGVPTSLQGREDKKGNITEYPMAYREREYEGYLLNQVIPTMCANLPTRRSLSPLGDGLHYKNGTFYVVNGECFCRGEVQEDKTIRWVDIDGLREGNLFTDGASSAWRWSQFFTTADEINKAKPVDLPAVFPKVRDFFDAGWTFDNRMETTYLAAYIFCVALADTYSAMPWMFVNAQYQSGKSFLVLNALSNTSKSSNIHLLEHSYGTDAFSEAGIRRRMSNASLTLILDEFEVGHENDRHLRKNQKAAKEILDGVRGAQAGGGATITIGSTTENAVTFHLRFPMVAAGIHTLSDAANVSRFNFVKLANIGKSGIRGGTPESEIHKKFSESDITEMRRAITMFALQNAERIRQSYAETCLEFADGQHFDPGAESRFKQQLMPVLNIIKMAGGDYKGFAAAYSKEKVKLFKTQYNTTEYDELWNTVLHTPGLRVPGEEFRDRTFTLAELLADVTKRNLINTTNTGVYWSSQDKTLVFAWHTMIGSILKGTPFSSRNANALKGLASTDSRVMTIEESLRSKVFGVIRQYGQRIENVSVIKALHFTQDSLDTPDTNGDIEAHVANGAKLTPLRKSIQADATDGLGDVGSHKYNI